MSGTWASIREETIWVVEANRSVKGESASWRFDDKEVAEWFRGIAHEYYMARCPSCEVKETLAIDLCVDDDFPVAIVLCTFFDCDFAKRVVRKDGLPMTVDEL